MDYKEIIKQFGDVIHDGHVIIDKPKMVIPLSPRLDIALGGGIQEGSWFILTGQPKAGKTLTALSFAATCQKPEYGERHIFYLNVEGRLKQRDVEGIEGLNLDSDKFTLIESNQDKILTASEYLQIAEMIIHESPGSIVIIDSFSSLVTESEYNTDMDKMQRADGPKLISKFCRKLCNVVPVKNCILIGITHVMGNPGFGMSEWKEKSGQTLKYQADFKIWAEYFKPITDEHGRPIRQEVTWAIKHSGITVRTQKTQSIITFGKGIDKLRELVGLAVDFSIIERKGAWYQYKDHKVQGEQKMIDYVEKEGLYDEIQEEVNAMVG